MLARLILAVISTLIWEGALLTAWLWGLPQLGIELHAAVLVVAMVLLAVHSVVSFHIGTRVLSMKATIGIPDMVGSRGSTVCPLTPEGMIMALGELWIAKSVEGNIDKGEAIEVVGQERLKLLVRRERLTTR
ncbi:MAG: hypothetical protein HY668_00955 [Chloroflexi bacterium]|nr:hypothetical protein [Chloroflexota bacterium]